MAGDLAFYFQVDLRDLYEPHGGRSRLTWYWLKVLWHRLPPESLSVTALREDTEDDPDLPEAEPGSGPWSREAMLLAEITDAIERLSFYLLRVNGNDPSKPKPLPRPGAKHKPSKLTAEQRAHLEALRSPQAAAEYQRRSESRTGQQAQRSTAR